MAQDQRQADQKLVIRLLSGDVSAFDELYLKYNKRVFGFCYGLLRSRDEAEGIVQEVFIKIWENKANLRPDLSFSWYLFTIARNSVINLINHRKYEKEFIRYSEIYRKGYENETEEQIFYSDALDQLENAINRLPPKRKEVFLLSRREGMSYQRIADTLKLSVKTVEVHISQALKQIREEFGKKELHSLSLILIIHLVFIF